MKTIIKKIKSLRIPFFSSLRIYFDMGTTMTRIGISQKGIVMRDATFLGYSNRVKEYIFFGNEARAIIGKTPDFISIIRPITSGILYDFDAAVAYIQYLLKTSVHPYLKNYILIKPPLTGITAAPSIATEIEKKALVESLEKAGCTTVHLVERALATAAGCGYDIFSHEPHMIIDFGGGLIELSIVSGGGIVSQRTLKTAGEQMNKLIANYAYFKYALVLGELTCEDIKIKLMNFTTDQKHLNVRGKSLETGLPKTVKISSADIREALAGQFHQVIDAAKELLELAPPEIADAVYKNGIALTGNLASFEHIEQFITKELGIDAFRVEHYEDATLIGLMKLDQNPERMYQIAAKV